MSSLTKVGNFRCTKCVRCSPVRSEELKEMPLGAESADLRLECVGKFCYLGDVEEAEAGGGGRRRS